MQHTWARGWRPNPLGVDPESKDLLSQSLNSLLGTCKQEVIKNSIPVPKITQHLP